MPAADTQVLEANYLSICRPSIKEMVRMRSVAAMSLAVLPSLAYRQAVANDTSVPIGPITHGPAAVNTAMTPMARTGEACGHASPKRTICGHGPCCSSAEMSVQGTRASGGDSCAPQDCLSEYSTGCALQGEMKAGLSNRVHDRFLVHKPRSRQVHVEPSLEWLANLDRPHLGSVPYGQVIAACTEPDTLALTFDDGPWMHTEDLLQLLEDKGVEATFFVCGSNMGGGDGQQLTGHGHPRILQRMLDDGHQIGSHTWGHPDLARARGDKVRQQLLLNEQALVGTVGVIPTYFRPPYLSYSQEVLNVLAGLGYHVISANVDTNDWKGDYEAARQSYVEAIRATRGDSSGKIVLAHDIHNRTVHELAGFMIDQAWDNGYRLVTVGECMGDPARNWYRNASSGRQSWMSPADEHPHEHPHKIHLPAADA